MLIAASSSLPENMLIEVGKVVRHKIIASWQQFPSSMVCGCLNMKASFSSSLFIPKTGISQIYNEFKPEKKGEMIKFLRNLMQSSPSPQLLLNSSLGS